MILIYHNQTSVKNNISVNSKFDTYFLWGICGISALGCIILLLIKGYIAISYLPDISGSEKSTIFPIQNIASHLPMYTDPEHPNFILSQYTPIYITFTAKILNLLNIDPENVHRVFVTSRLVSLSFLSICILSIFLFLRKTTSILIALLASFFTFQILSYWYLTSSRPDSLLVLLTVLYIIVSYRAIQQNNTKSWLWILAIFIAVSAFFVKQSGAIHSIVLGIFCLVIKEYKLLFKLVASGLLFFLLYLLILPINTLEIFFLNIVGGVANSTSWPWFYDWTLQRLLLPFAPLLALNLLLFTNISFKHSDRNPFHLFLSIASISFFLFATLTAFKIGSGVGYYQDYLITTVIFISHWIWQLHNQYTDNLFRREFRLFAGFYLAIVAIHCTVSVYMTYSSNPLQSYGFQYQEQKEIASYLHNDKKLNINDKVYICGGDNYHGYYLTHFLHKNVLMPFPDIIWLAEKNETFDFHRFSEKVSKSEIRFVISKKDERPVSILGHDFPGIQLVKSTREYDIYESVRHTSP